ncbi:9938_t:CDS:1, partial [Dentiscutata erythropus]
RGVVNQDSKKASKSDSDQQNSVKLILAKFYLNVVVQNQKKAVKLFLELSKSELNQQNSLSLNLSWLVVMNMD